MLRIMKGYGKLRSILVIVAASLCCLNSYNGDFVFDDSEAIVNNKDTKTTPIHQIFTNDFWGTKITHKDSHKSYRPLTTLSFRLHFLMRKELDPKDFHIFNIILHAIVCILTYIVLQIFFKWKREKLAYYTSLLFAVHPVHVEAIAGIVGRADILCTLFTWTAVIFFSIAIDENYWILKYLYSLVCLISLFSAIFCKEIGITALGICLMYDVIVVNKILPFKIHRPHSIYNSMKINIMQNTLFVRSIMLLFTGIILLVIRFQIMGFSQPTFKPIDNPASFISNSVLRILNYNYIYWLNLWILICPQWLCFDWSMGCVPLLEGLDLKILCVLLLWILLGIIFKLALIDDTCPQGSRDISIGITLLTIPFLPSSNIFFKVGFVIAERTLYLPSIGFCLIVALGFEKLIRNISYKKLVWFFYYFTIVIFFIRSWIRSEECKTETTLFNSGEKVCPLNAKIHYNIAKNAGDHGDMQYAKEKYEQALRLNPTYAQAMNNLGNLLKEEKKFLEAEKYLRQAVNIQSNFAAAWMNLGIVLTNSKKFDEAEKSYFTAISLRQPYPDCFFNLGLLYLEVKNYSAALNAWNISVMQDPKHQKAWTNIILLLSNMGDIEEAIFKAKTALNYISNDPLIHFNIGNILGKKGHFEEAEKHFRTAISLNPYISVYYTNLGVLYHRWKKYRDAEAMYERAIEINNDSLTAKSNLQKLRTIMENLVR